MIEGIQKRAVLAHQRRLGGGGTGVNAQIAVALVGGKIALLYFYTGSGAPGKSKSASSVNSGSRRSTSNSILILPESFSPCPERVRDTSSLWFMAEPIAANRWEWFGDDGVLLVQLQRADECVASSGRK